MSVLGKKLIPWQIKHGRNNLPWQQDPTPYRVWVSEIMLQQTQVETVKAYYLRFMHKFPTLSDLAAASQEFVLQLWTGLGYYARARHLHHAAQIIMTEHQGIFPDTLIKLTELPGIGRSTAGAILSFSMNQSAVILDGNVKRVLTRVHAIKAWPGDPNIQKQLWEIATQHTPKKQTHIYNQALMDLGSMICTRRAPKCPLCPLRHQCLAYQHNQQELIPLPKPKKTLPEKHGYLLILFNKKNNTVLLHKRPAPGIWGGLWCFPECAKPVNSNLIQTTLTHTFTHYRWHLQPVKIITQSNRIPRTCPKVSISGINWTTRFPLALAAPIKKLESLINFQEKMSYHVNLY